MQHLHKQETDQFKKLFKQEKIDNYEDRIKVLEAFLQTEKHLTARELASLLAESGFELSVGFVRDTLKLMCHFGFAEKHSFDNGTIRYEHRHLGQHHDHMVCTKCRKIIEFKDEKLEALQGRVAAAHGFHMLQHKMEIYGICDGCLQSRRDLMPLALAKSGESLVVRELAGGAGARLRLATMGLRVGDRIEVITNISSGQLVVASDSKRLVLGRGLAEKIIAQPVASGSD